MHPFSRPNAPARRPRTAPSFTPLFAALLLSAPLLCQCHVWKAHKSMEEVRLEIQEDRLLEMDEVAAYHLDVAQGLLVTAEKQYEDADFTAATALSEQAAEQLDRSRKIRAFQKLMEPEESGGAR